MLKNLEDLSDKLDSIDDDDDDDDSFDLGDLSVLSGLGDLGKLAKAFGGKIVDGTDTIETKEGKTILKSNRQLHPRPLQAEGIGDDCGRARIVYRRYERAAGAYSRQIYQGYI